MQLLVSKFPKEDLKICKLILTFWKTPKNTQHIALSLIALKLALKLGLVAQSCIILSWWMSHTWRTHSLKQLASLDMSPQLRRWSHHGEAAQIHRTGLRTSISKLFHILYAHSVIFILVSMLTINLIKKGYSLLLKPSLSSIKSPKFCAPVKVSVVQSLQSTVSNSSINSPISHYKSTTSVAPESEIWNWQNS